MASQNDEESVANRLINLDSHHDRLMMMLGDYKRKLTKDGDSLKLVEASQVAKLIDDLQRLQIIQTRKWIIHHQKLAA